MIGGVGGRVHVCKSCSMCSPATYFAGAGPAVTGAVVPGSIVPSRTSSPSGRPDPRVSGSGLSARQLAGMVSAAGRAGESRSRTSGPGGLTPEQQREVAALRRRDAEVRAHEAAHKAVAGSLGGAVSYTFQRGPDGALYAIGGEVPITLGEGRTPEETVQRAQQVRAAALAPAQPSSADRSVASAASALEADALREIQQQRRERSGSDAADPTSTSETRSQDRGAEPSARDAGPANASDEPIGSSRTSEMIRAYRRGGGAPPAEDALQISRVA